jgi:ankyrin repeat protein
MLAAVNNGPEVVAAILKAGANINAQDAIGFTALMDAAKNTVHSEVVVLLLQSGADANIVDKNGKTALYFARGNKKLVGTNAYLALERATKPSGATP